MKVSYQKRALEEQREEKMFKKLSAVVLILVSGSAFSMDSHSKMLKNLIRNQLWFEGITTKQEKLNQALRKGQAKSEMPEELSIALEKFDY